ncbi:hypothetical protein N7U49_41280 [Streptomyces sp. AD2-2]|nr:hypothetical protein N7U49_41280 [Streptomyces sp. AD2-2]
MYQFPVSFTAQPEPRDSLANEPGSRRFEVIADEENPDAFSLNEVHTEGPTRLMRGSLVGDNAAA